MSNQKTKHTPGPWVAQTHHKVNTKNGKCNVIHQDGPMFCIIDGIPFREAQANARLIAAAPEMLEALNHVIEYINRCLQDKEALKQSDLTKILVSVLNPAITKATGGAE